MKLIKLLILNLMLVGSIQFASANNSGMGERSDSVADCTTVDNGSRSAPTTIAADDSGGTPQGPGGGQTQ